MSTPRSGRRATVAPLRAVFFAALAAVIGGCTVTRQPEPPPLDLSPVACGHRWIQSAHSPRTQHVCSDDTAELLTRLEPATTDTLWDAARIRCPAECEPVELDDPFDDHGAEFTNCKNDWIYLRVSKFLHCRP